MRLRLFLVNFLPSSHTWWVVRDCADLAKAHFEAEEELKKHEFYSSWQDDLTRWEEQLKQEQARRDEEPNRASLEDWSTRLEDKEAVLTQRAAAIEKDGYAVLTLPEARAWEWVKGTLPGIVGYAGRPALEDKA